MDARSVALVQQSFEQAATLGDSVAEIFYAELFAIDPSLRQMFKDDMTDQRKKLLSALSLVVRSLHAPEKILGAVKTLAVRHVSYGVEAHHYTSVGNALLRTLRKGLGGQFTPELYSAWADAYRMLADIMKEAAYGNPEQFIRELKGNA